jgi:hypothetical protein
MIGPNACRNKRAYVLQMHEENAEKCQDQVYACKGLPRDRVRSHETRHRVRPRRGRIMNVAGVRDWG